jgi:acyl dehydratase
MIDRKWTGHEFPAAAFTLERGRMRFFAKTIGEDDPIYFDEAAARAAGYADLPALPTFLFSAELDSGALASLIETLQIPIPRMLHGEQSFTYHKPVCAGETVTVQSRIGDIYDKKNGALEFVVKDSFVRNAAGELVAEYRGVIVIRN